MRARTQRALHVRRVLRLLRPQRPSACPAAKPVCASAPCRDRTPPSPVRCLTFVFDAFRFFFGAAWHRTPPKLETHEKMKMRRERARGTGIGLAHTASRSLPWRAFSSYCCHYCWCWRGCWYWAWLGVGAPCRSISFEVRVPESGGGAGPPLPHPNTGLEGTRSRTACSFLSCPSAGVHGEKWDGAEVGVGGVGGEAGGTQHPHRTLRAASDAWTCHCCKCAQLPPRMFSTLCDHLGFVYLNSNAPGTITMPCAPLRTFGD